MPRTDNDTWDLATSVGATATMVAAARAVATKADNPLINDQFAEPLVRAVGIDFLTRLATGDLNAADVDAEDSTWKLQQMPDAMAARTRFFDAFFAEATEAGIRQAVILASGLDARAYRLAWPTGMTVFEVDQPEEIAFKTETLDRLLHNISALSADGSRLATEAIPDMPDVDQENARELMRKATDKWRSHGFDLNFEERGYEGDRNDVAEYLIGLGWRSIGQPMTQLLAEHGLPPFPQTSDSVSMAGTIYYTSAK